jgi:hypothetical protein
LERYKVHTGDEDMDVIASDLTMEVRGRIDRGAAFGIVGGGSARTWVSDIGNLSIASWSETIDD